MSSRGRGTSSRVPHRHHRSDDVLRPVSPAVGGLIEAIHRQDLQKSKQVKTWDKSQIEIQDVKFLASFNWLTANTKTILVPGEPPAWTPPTEPSQLQEDSGQYFRDINAARSPKHPMLPAVRAVYAEHDNFDGQSIDLFACSRTMERLLGFACHAEKSFRFFVETVGNTVFFIRRENSPTETIPDIRGYGHTFPEAYTTWDRDVEGSASSQRLLQYELAGLTCVVRYNSDGYLPSKVSGSATSEMQSSAGAENSLLEDTLHGTSLALASAVDAAVAEKLELREGGRRIPQEATFDLKTRSAWRVVNVLEEEMPRLWLSQIPNFITARHSRGVFHQIEIENVKEAMKDWKNKHNVEVGRFCWLLNKIMEVARAHDDGKIEVCCKGSGGLELRHQDSADHGVLPGELRDRWLDQLGQDIVAEGSGSPGGVSLDGDVIVEDDGRPIQSLEEGDEDYTACREECGYCGRCSRL